MKAIAKQEILVEVPPQDSPRLAWLKKHGVSTKKMASETGDEDEFGSGLFPWYASTNFRSEYETAGGATEQDAIANLAIRRGWKLWMEENYGK